jgi:hypothetical protein
MCKTLCRPISNDKAKLHAYCEMGKLQQQIEKTEEGNDAKSINAFVAEADAIAQQIGPELWSVRCLLWSAFSSRRP